VVKPESLEDVSDDVQESLQSMLKVFEEYLAAQEQ
jgi:hypothetical protein